MTQPVRYAVIGFGDIIIKRIAPEAFALDTKRFPPVQNAVLVAATSHSPSRQADVEKFGLKWYPNEEELLVDPDIDAIFIGSNNQTHFEIANRCLDAGKHVLCEKPLTITVEEAQTLCTKAVEKKLSLCADLMMIYNAATIKAHDMIASGAIGDVNDAEFHFEFPIAFDPVSSKAWRCSEPREKGGPIGDIGSHCFYTLEYVLGSEIVSVKAVNLPKVSETAVEDGTYIRATLANGLIVTVRLSFASKRGSFLSMVSAQGYEVYGSKGVLRTYGTLFQFSGHTDEELMPRVEIETFEPDVRVDVPIPQSEVRNIYRAVVERHSQSIVDKKPLDGSDALHNMKVCDAAYASAAANGKEVVVAK